MYDLDTIVRLNAAKPQPDEYPTANRTLRLRAVLRGCAGYSLDHEGDREALLKLILEAL